MNFMWEEHFSPVYSSVRNSAWHMVCAQYLLTKSEVIQASDQKTIAPWHLGVPLNPTFEYIYIWLHIGVYHK